MGAGRLNTGQPPVGASHVSEVAAPVKARNIEPTHSVNRGPFPVSL